MLLGCAIVVDRPDIVIGTGSPSGIDYPLGGSICRLFNLDAPPEERRCAAILSTGPVANIDSLRAGRTDIGIVPSDVLADAIAGQEPFAARGPNPDLRVLFTGHADAFTIVARRELAIHSAAELRGRRINLGSPGSGERVSMERIMAALGVTRSDFAQVRELTLAEQHRALCANELDAIVYSVGHPNGLIEDVVRMCRGVLVDVSGTPIDDMLQHHPEYERAVIKGGTYLDNPVDAADPRRARRHRDDDTAVGCHGLRDHQIRIRPFRGFPSSASSLCQPRGRGHGRRCRPGPHPPRRRTALSRTRPDALSATSLSSTRPNDTTSISPLRAGIEVTGQPYLRLLRPPDHRNFLNDFRLNIDGSLLNRTTGTPKCVAQK